MRRAESHVVPSYQRPNKSFTGEQHAQYESMWKQLEERSATNRRALLGWLDEVGGSTEFGGGRFQLWRAPVGAVVRALASDGDEFLSIEGVLDKAICAVFGGDNAKQCDNLLLVQTLVPHEQLPVEGFVIYADS